jgi:3D (Asp-Asp-Asp) domain-containing protein
MKTPKKQILVAVFLAIAIMSSTANAGLLDWFAGSKARAEQGSFDQLYASLTTETPTVDDRPILLASLNAIEGVSSPVGGVSRTLRRMYTVQVSGYNSEAAQTDDSPFITANGTHVRDGIVAANIIDAAGRNIPFNTVIKFKNCGGIPEDKIFTVTDRLNKRYTRNVDIWFAHKSDALKFGRRTCQIEVIS